MLQQAVHLPQGTSIIAMRLELVRTHERQERVQLLLRCYEYSLTAVAVWLKSTSAGSFEVNGAGRWALTLGLGVNVRVGG